jgi:hypothetical protein
MEEAISRNEHRDRNRKRNRTLAIVGGVAVVAAAGVVVALALSNGNDDSATSTHAATTASHSTTVELPLGSVSADSAGPAVTVGPDQSQQVRAVLDTYVKDAMVQPLRSGTPVTADLGAVFDATTLASASTTDRGALLDEGLPKVTGDLTVVASPIALVGLGDQSGALTLVTAATVLDVHGQTVAKGAPLHIVRRADFVLAPDGAGVWKVTGYDIVVTRDGAGLSETTTTSGAAT